MQPENLTSIVGNGQFGGGGSSDAPGPREVPSVKPEKTENHKLVMQRTFAIALLDALGIDRSLHLVESVTFRVDGSSLPSVTIQCYVTQKMADGLWGALQSHKFEMNFIPDFDPVAEAAQVGAQAEEMFRYPAR